MIVIKDMEMPNYCNDCDFVADSLSYCERANEHIPNYDFFSDKNEKPSWCPLENAVERSTMEILCNEYLSKCNCCDECCAEYFCIENQLRTEKRDCVNNLITYFTERNIGERL